MLTSCDVYGSGSIEEAHVNCDKLDKTTHEITDDSYKVSRPDTEKRHETLGTLFSTAAAELNNQNTERLPTGYKNLDNLLGGGIETEVITQVYGQGAAKHSYVSLYV